ncbi:segregation and condensation protein A [Bacillota bacterium Meth-B3]|nr:segregation/condensation protein A [Christensenellaceae bacterium]MEA5066972.1 segregation/condensation protein A [Eubacteriales bacterium]MEA5068358.1 segregation/condensation protein A [Christensenellaceae bacterium]
MSYVVSLKQFDGPLDLLLTLITRAKIDVVEIFVSQITEQYLESMTGVDDLDMDAASEFLQMAATLLEIKSRALLPTPRAEPEEGEESPEQALIRQLTEYKAFKELSKRMQSLEGEARALLTKLPEEYPLPPPAFELTGLTLDALARAFARVLKRLEDTSEVAEPPRREIARDSYTVQSCMVRIRSRLRKGETRFSQLFEGVPGKSEVIAVFLALLELLKLGRVRAQQKGVYADILLTAA